MTYKLFEGEGLTVTAFDVGGRGECGYQINVHDGRAEQYVRLTEKQLGILLAALAEIVELNDIVDKVAAMERGPK